MPIVVGAPRSGTTLLRLMLDAHPDMAIPPETGFLTLCTRYRELPAPDREEFIDAIIGFPPDIPAWQDFRIPQEAFRDRLRAIEPFAVAQGYRAFYQLYAERFGKRRWGDKTPVHGFAMTAIEDVLPEAHFLHVIRDGRDVCLSLRPMWFSPGWDIETQARHWREFVAAARDQGRRCRRYLEVRYERLVMQPREVLHEICAFLDLRYDDAMLDYYRRAPGRLQEHETRRRLDGAVVVTKEQRFHQQASTMRPPDVDRVFAWKNVMVVDERRRFDAVAGRLLAELGYETGAG